MTFPPRLPPTWLLLVFPALLAVALAAQEPRRQPEATSLLGQPLFAPEMAPERRAQFEEKLALARSEFEGNPDNAEAIIWLGRRTAYLGRYREAISLFTQGLRKHPTDARLYRHRGHRYLTVRELDPAIADLEEAARLVAGQPDEVEPDGMPNPSNIPRSTLQSNIWYHLGLAYYLKGDFARADRAFTECLAVSRNDDMLVATLNWLYLSRRRHGEHAAAAKLLERVHPEMEILENASYHKLLLLHKGELEPEALLARAEDDLERATLGYGVGAWYLLKGQGERARTVFEGILAGGLWPAFGFLAAEAELARTQSQLR